MIAKEQLHFRHAAVCNAKKYTQQPTLYDVINYTERDSSLARCHIGHHIDKARIRRLGTVKKCQKEVLLRRATHKTVVHVHKINE
jgi:hypothetical protein